MTEIIGIDHIYIAVADMARSTEFYDRALMAAMGFRKSSFLLAGDPHVHYYNRHFGYVLRPARVCQPAEGMPGLHHLCLRVATPDDVAALANTLQELGIAATPAQCHPEYAPDYWATYFTDPDGLRLEVTNYRQERRERFEQWNDDAGIGSQ